MPDSPVRRYAARFDQLPSVLADVRATCQAAGFTETTTLRVELALEEAFSNCIKHGYGGESEHPVWLTATMLPDGLRFVFQDGSPPFNPLSGATLPEEQRPGGVGRVLITQLPHRAQYEYSAGRNTLTLDFDRTR